MDVVSPFRNKKSISLVLTFKYYPKYKSQLEAKYLVSGLAVTKNRALFPTCASLHISRISSSSPPKDIHRGYEPKFFQVSQVRQDTNASPIGLDKRRTNITTF